MARKKSPKSQTKTEGNPSDIEGFLINKISKCQRIVNELKENGIWKEIQEDYDQTAKSLDSAWAFVDPLSTQFKQMQVTKMAATTFMNLLPNYEHDLKLAKDQLDKLRNPETIIKKDFDEEGIETTSTSTTTLGATAYHGR